MNPRFVIVRKRPRPVSVPLDRGEWTSLASSPTPTFSAPSAYFRQEFYAGGGDSTTYASYDPSLDTWRSRASAPSRHKDGQGAFTGGYFYAAGGFGSNNNIHRYDPYTDSWTKETSFSNAYVRLSFTFVAYNGALWRFGGDRYIGDGQYKSDKTVERYDLSTGTFGGGAPDMPTQLTRGASVLDGTTLYMVGGQSYRTRTDTLLLYDFAAGTYSYGAPLPTQRVNHGAIIRDGKIYCVGGQNGDDYRLPFYIYIIADDTWITGGDHTILPTPRRRSSIYYDDARDTIYVVGGKDPDNTSLWVNEAFAFD